MDSRLLTYLVWQSACVERRSETTCVAAVVAVTAAAAAVSDVSPTSSARLVCSVAASHLLHWLFQQDILADNAGRLRARHRGMAPE